MKKFLVGVQFEKIWKIYQKNFSSTKSSKYIFFDILPDIENKNKVKSTNSL